MKKFIIKLSQLACLLFISLVIVAEIDYYVIGSQYEYNYQASIIDKVNRLESINEPKIILVGNSNLAFGIDSEMIEKEIGMPVVNLGLHGGLGNAFHEEMAKLGVNKGDIVIVCHSELNDDNKISDPALAWITVDNHKEIWKIVRPKDYPTMLLAYPNYVRNSFFLWIRKQGNKDGGGTYSRSAFNIYGDNVIHSKIGQMDTNELFSQVNIRAPYIGDTWVKRMNDYNKYISSRGATLLIAAYPIARGRYSKFSPEDFVIMQKTLENELDCDVISDYTEYFYPYEYFYDTTLHLTDEGAKVRTKQLIEDIRNWMSE